MTGTQYTDCHCHILSWNKKKYNFLLQNKTNWLVDIFSSFICIEKVHIYRIGILKFTFDSVGSDHLLWIFMMKNYIIASKKIYHNIQKKIFFSLDGEASLIYYCITDIYFVIKYLKSNIKKENMISVISSII